MSNLNKLQARELREGLDKKDFSSVEVVKDCLKSIKESQDINAFISVFEDQALKQAKSCDEKLATGDTSPLLGIPVALKDAILVKDFKTTSASKMLENFTAPYDAHVTEGLKKSGAVIIGKTNLDEFCMGSSGEHSAFGATKNPWKHDRVPGGTSSGSTAAVSAANIPFSLGSDTGGSIRLPAAYCGVVGLKPTYGRVSRYGVIAYASSLDQVGCIARSSYDTAFLLSIIAGYDKRDATSVNKTSWDFHKTISEYPKKLKIGLPKEYFNVDGIEDDIKVALDKTIKFFKDQGAEVTEISLPHTDLALSVYYIIAPAEAASNLSRYDGIRYGYRSKEASDLNEIYTKSRSEGFGLEVKRRILVGNYVLSSGYYDAYYRKAQKIRTLVRNDFKSTFEDQGVDLILAPTSPTTAFKLGENEQDPIQMYLNDIYTIPASLSGLPGISFPIGKDKNELPIGCQLISNYWNENLLLQVVNRYEEEIGWDKIATQYA